MCDKCKGEGIVCSEHMNKPWKLGACCGNQMGHLCECNPIYEEMKNAGMLFVSVAAIITAEEIVAAVTGNTRNTTMH